MSCLEARHPCMVAPSSMIRRGRDRRTLEPHGQCHPCAKISAHLAVVAFSLPRECLGKAPFGGFCFPCGYSVNRRYYEDKIFPLLQTQSEIFVFFSPSCIWQEPFCKHQTDNHGLSSKKPTHHCLPGSCYINPRMRAVRLARSSSST